MLRAEFLVYVDTGMDDGHNGDLVKKYLMNQIKSMKLGDDNVRFRLATFHNSDSSSSSLKLDLLTPLDS